MRSDVSFLFLFNFSFNIFACSKNSAHPGKHHFTFFLPEKSVWLFLLMEVIKKPPPDRKVILHYSLTPMFNHLLLAASTTSHKRPPIQNIK